MSTEQKGKAIEQLMLHSDECLLLLRQALEVCETTVEETTQTRVSTYQSRYADSSDEEKTEESSSSSEESSEDEQEDSKDETGFADTTASLPEAAAALTLDDQSDNPKPDQRKKKKRIPAGQRQRKIEIQKHVDSLACSSLALQEPKDAVLEISSSLLSKEDRLSQNQKVIAQSFLSLASAIGSKQKPVVVLCLRSGRFACGVFTGGTCAVHRALQRYTVRKGQGKAQSVQDSQRRAKSMGSQLRRAGEQKLQEDIAETITDWKEHVEQAALVLISCPKTMRKSLFDSVESVIAKDDQRIRRVPLDVGRPTYETVCLIYDVLMTATVREIARDVDTSEHQKLVEDSKMEAPASNADTVGIEADSGPVPAKIDIPLTALHIAAKDGDLQSIQEIASACCDDINQLAGEDWMSPLHFAAESTAEVNPSAAADCVYQLLVSGKADPCIVDARNRPPYFLASSDKIRDAFRMARAALGEEYCRWDEDAKVGPPLTEEDIQFRKEKEAEKRRKKRQRQKEKKARDNAEAAEAERRRLEEEERQKKEEEAKRIRDGLQPKPGSAGNMCDFCQTVCKGRRRSQMFKRLDYVYCSTECVQKHKRELMASAALARFN